MINTEAEYNQMLSDNNEYQQDNQREMKTPIQELIEKVEHATDYNLEGANVKEYTWGDLHSDMYKLLEKEKEFIEDVFVDGMEEEYQFHINGIKQISSSEYYDKKFKK